MAVAASRAGSAAAAVFVAVAVSVIALKTILWKYNGWQPGGSTFDQVQK